LRLSKCRRELRDALPLLLEKCTHLGELTTISTSLGLLIPTSRSILLEHLAL